VLIFTFVISAGFLSPVQHESVNTHILAFLRDLLIKNQAAIVGHLPDRLADELAGSRAVTYSFLPQCCQFDQPKELGDFCETRFSKAQS